jgi:transcription termination factor Rho
MLHLLNDDERTDRLIDKLAHTKSNEEFLASLSKGA